MTENATSRAVFLDLHGTLGDQGPHGIDGFTFYPFAIDAIKLLNAAKLHAIVVTNQSRIARGQFTEDDFDEFARRLCGQIEAGGGTVAAVYHCPHTAAVNCDCRKPRTGLLDRARRDFGIKLEQCWVVGDVGAFDIALARNAGCGGVLVRTGWGEGSLGPYRHLWADIEPDHVAANVLAAATWIVTQTRH